MAAATKKIVLLFTLVSLVLTTFTDHADARRRKRRQKRSRRAPIINEKKLYERIGGPKRVGEIVDEWMRLNLADGRVATAFATYTAVPAKLARERRSLSDQLCELADGPCTVKTEPAKKGAPDDSLRLDESQFVVFGDNLFKSMQKFGIPEREKNELLGRLGEIRTDFIDSKEDAKTDSTGKG